jgi:hypothetical protein
VYSCPAAATPGAPTIGTASASDAAATVTWSAPTPNGGAPVTGYLVTARNGTTTKSARVDATATKGTVGSLTNGLPWTLVVQAESSAGTGPASAASAAVTPRWVATIALTASPATVVFPAKSNVTMSVVRKGTTTPVPAADVQLFGRKTSAPAGTAWTYLGHATTDLAGKVATPRAQYSTTDYLARLYESAAVAGPSTTSPLVRVYVAHAVSIAASSTAIKLGQTVTLSGSVYPQHSGKVVLQKLSGTSWVNLTGERATSSTGTYSIGYTPTARAAVRTVRVVSVATPDNVSGTSATRSFSIS